MNELLETQTIEFLCETYQDAQNDIAEAFRLLQQAKERLKKAFGEHVSILPHNMNDYNLPSEHEQAKTLLKRDAWRYIMRKAGVREWCSIKQANEFDRQIETDTKSLPEITLMNIEGLLKNLYNNADHMFAEALQEVFDFLRPGKWCHHKTNDRFEVGKKVIIDWGIDTSYGFMHPIYQKEQCYRALDNVFHLLDGQGISTYPGDFLTKLKDACSHKVWECETTYFRCKWYKRGTLHIEFKRLDLVAELNKRAGGMNLKGQRQAS